MELTLLIAVYCGIAPALFEAIEAPRMPAGVPPHLVTVGSIDLQKGEIGLQNRTVRFVWEPNRKAVYEERGWTLTVESAEAFDANGKKLKREELWKRIAVGAVVALSADAQEVDPAFLEALAKDTLVFVSAEHAVNHVPQAERPAEVLLRVAPPGF
jgi:hypothetical protein